MACLLYVVLLSLAAAVCQSARPSFRELQSNYPTYAKYPADGQKLKTDMGLPDWLYPGGRAPNTCAIRMSKAFTDAGYSINRNSVTSCSTSSAGVNGNGNQYIVRALFFKCYLQAIWGRPEISSATESNIRNKKGLLIFTGCTSFGQHMDLWDGYSCSMNCPYFDVCSNIIMYTLS